MSNNIPESYLFTEKDLPLYELAYVFSDCSVWLESGMGNKVATFDLFIRDRPKNRNFMVFLGIDEIIESLKKWKYSEEDVEYLLSAGIITEKFAEYLRNFKF